LFRSLHPSSLASRVLRLFQLTPSHTEEALAALASVVLAVIAVAFIAGVYIAVQPYAVEWRQALVLLPSVLLPEHIMRRAADTIPTHRATRAF
jgi:hypothetical protein